MTGGTAGDARLGWRAFDELDRDALYDLLALRCRVFVLEQGSPYLDIDGADRAAEHLTAHGPEGALLGCLRLLPPGSSSERGAAAFGRVAVAEAARGRGLGGRLVGEALARIDARWPEAETRIGAQARLEAFYARFGFARAGALYDDGGVPHYEMTRPAVRRP